ncbi:hypothetical protein E2C01_019211 [Portunus trituberculatus]|uniref:Uncharacterized protein n=1 Tax=Portunus trituberculatus TaxID=210409 RepID=A0A5B7DWZ9_PORTR|nr:hypothetical protein [Portunus trituberculatus]
MILIHRPPPGCARVPRRVTFAHYVNDESHFLSLPPPGHHRLQPTLPPDAHSLYSNGPKLFQETEER